MIEVLVGAIMSIGSLLLGYYLGRSDGSSAKQTIAKTRQVIEEIVHGKPDVGPVMRPDNTELRRMNDPVFAAEEKTMIDTFDELIERRVEP